ncbi:MAG: hypothetical protein AAGE43_11750 [Pseudomonadota bacterium]
MHRQSGKPVLRRSRNALLLILGLVAGAYGFGSSGVALGVLWWRARAGTEVGSKAGTEAGTEAGGQTSFLPAPVPEVWLRSATLRSVHLTPWRALFVDRELGRLEIFADELTPGAWARLRRQVLSSAR